MGQKMLTTREAARFLDLSTVALLRKADLLGAEKDARGWYLWPKDKLCEYKEAVAGKALNDPTRGEELERN